MDSSRTYIHYSSDAFDINKFKPMPYVDEGYDRYLAFSLNKPPHGTCFWGSPVGDKFGWKEWLEAEDWETERLEKSFEFTLKPSARILKVTSTSDVSKYVKRIPEENGRLFVFEFIDFIEMAKDYDGCEVCHDNNYEELHMGLFCTWDCNSIVIWNPDIIVPV